MNTAHILATDLLLQLGFSAKITKSGPAEVLKALNTIGVKPVDQKVYGRGISFFVSAEDANIAIKQKATSKKDAEPRDALRRDIRSLSRSILDLYQMLGETPSKGNSIFRIAERDIDAEGTF